MPLRIKTYLRESPGKGLGLFTAEDIGEGQVIYEDDPTFDRIIPGSKKERMPQVQQEYVEKYASYNEVTDTYYLCSDDARFWNHSEDPNTMYSKETGQVTTLRHVAAGEELTSNYEEFCDNFKNGKDAFLVLP